MRVSSPGPPGQANAAPWRRWLIPGIIAASSCAICPAARRSPGPALSYTQFLADVSAGTVRAVTIGPAGQVTGSLASGQPFTTTIPVALGGNGLAGDLAAHHVQVTATAATAPSSSLLSVLIGLLPLLLIGGPLFFVFRDIRRQAAAGGGLGGLNSLTKAKARVIDAERPTTRFTDVAGYANVKTEITEVVDYLRDPGRYHRAGARGPRGVLMAGPPGTGKTLLARAAAGEARVPFFSVSGSGFVEMFVGLGAARVRDLFEQARTRAPAIVFIDEIDALAPAATTAASPAATSGSRPSTSCSPRWTGSISPPGSWCWPPPTGRTPWTPRCAVLAGLTARSSSRCPTGPSGVPSWPPTPAARPSAQTPTWTRSPPPPPDSPARTWPTWSTRPPSPRPGDRIILTAADFDSARDRVLLGTRHTSPLAPGELATVAVHEAGHALVATLSPYADPVSRVTVLGAGQALGRPRCSPPTTAGCTGKGTWPTPSPSASAAGPPNA